MPRPASPPLPYTTLFRSALFTGGHCLITGVPGLAKTLLIRTLSEILDLSFKRIQFTPDLMPADITGTEILDESSGTRVLRFVQDRKSTRLNSSHLGTSYAAASVTTPSLHDALPICLVHGRALPDHRCARSRQDAADSHAVGDSRSQLQAHPVHARPDAGRHHRHRDPRRVLRHARAALRPRSEEHTSELQSLRHLVCRGQRHHPFPTRRSSDLPCSRAGTA